MLARLARSSALEDHPSNATKSLPPFLFITLMHNPMLLLDTASTKDDRKLSEMKSARQI
jgi:hypothetical protein